MNQTNRSTGKVGLVLAGALAVALTGCTTYVEQRSPRRVYVPPPVAPPVVVTQPQSAVVVIHAESDFYEPLTPYGQWVVVGAYGRCWRPARVDVGWRPYCDGHWQRTDAGWYWASDEPWAWATYHYGRWDWSVDFGWYWVPRTQWAPAWVSWHQGGGYMGWAPLHPSARTAASGIVDVDVKIIAPRSFVFVEERRFLEPVRPKTVIVNNTTIINQTVNITNIKVVNNTVINEGPRAQVIERVSGRKVQSVPARELRRTQEAAVVARQRTTPSASGKTVQAAVSDSEPREKKVVPSRELRPAEGAVETQKDTQPPTKRNEIRTAGEPKAAPKPARPETELPARIEGKQEVERENAKSGTAPAAAAPKAQQEARPGTAPLRREARQAERPSEVTKQPQPPAQRSEVRGAGGQQSAPKPVRPDAERRPGNERQRELERVKSKAGTEQPAAVQKSTRPSTTNQVEKPKPSAKEKPAASGRGAKNPQKKDANTKAEEEQTPPRQPAVPPSRP